mgnify:CR=1 FL=1
MKPVQRWANGTVRTNRARLVEWLGDMLFEASGIEQSEYHTVIPAFELQAEPWADRIMEDMRLGIIKPELGGK